MPPGPLRPAPFTHGRKMVARQRFYREQRQAISGRTTVTPRSTSTHRAEHLTWKTVSARTKARNWLRGLVLALILFVIAVAVSAIFIANDPANAAGGINGFLYSLDDGAKSMLRAPINFFGSLLTFVERLGS